jgi:hypothetical protein
MNGGRPELAVAALRQVQVEEERTYQHIVYAAVYWDGDTIIARHAHDRLGERLARRAPAATLTAADADAICAVQTWRLTNGRTDGAAAAIALLAGPTGRGRLVDEVCAAKLTALLAHQTQSPDASRHLARLDSLLRTGPNVALAREHGNIAAARMFAASGDYAGALNAASRTLVNMNGQYYRSTFFELEGRYAAALGQTERARRAWLNYLALRAEPEPAVADRVERVRRELAALGEARR